MKERTIFDTPVLDLIFVFIARALLKFHGWKPIGEHEKATKYVLIAAPHTSNWDMYFMMLVAVALRIKIYWMGKQTIFKFPFYHLMTWLGGIPVDRSKSNDMVQATVDTFNAHEHLIITVPPEGTRSNVSYWKTGFYHIAKGSKLPICLGYLDFKKKQGGLGPMFHPTGNIEEDMKEIKEFYATVAPKNPKQYNTE